MGVTKVAAITISIANQKGGVGKTTATFNLAVALVKKNKSVLIVDNDPQGNLSSYASQDLPEDHKKIDEIYLSREGSAVKKNDLYEINDKLFLLPSDNQLAGVEYYLISRPKREEILRHALAAIKNEFDFILIDNPPSLNLLTVNGLVASEQVIVPVQPEYFSLEGIAQLRGTLEDLRKWHPSISLLGLFPNMFDNRRKLNVDVLKLLDENFGDLMFKTKVHNSVKIAESSGFAKSVLDYSPSSRSAAEFRDLAQELVTRLENL